MSTFQQQIQQQLGVVPPPLPTIPEPPAIWQVRHFHQVAYDWLLWKAVAAKYLPDAVRIRFRTESDSNDEGGTNTYLLGLIGYDVNGAKLEIEEGLREEFDETKDDWDLPDNPDLVMDFTVLPTTTFASRAHLLQQVTALQAWVESLPDACFYVPKPFVLPVPQGEW